jgi:lipopolysaccharide/colanic/teichoic acid biosynthesis glycosyltransferase
MDVLFRVRDFLGALLILILAAPLMLFIAIMIRLDSPGPAIFKQRRIGRREDGDETLNGSGKPFVFYKFRTMHVDAQSRFPDLYRYDYTPAEIETITFKLLDDPRLTRFGRWLRKTSLDELPNFLNVLKGDMSLVGPRPDIPEMVRFYKDWQRVKFLTKPGVTGYAQTNGRGLLTFQETLQEDVRYVRERSFMNDLEILWKTVRVTVKRIGAF